MKLYSKIYGDGSEDLIIIHGLFGMSDNWNSLGKDFSKYYKVHLVDLRNHGRSPHSEQFDYEVMCEDIIQYIEDHNINKSIILGHSLGGKVAMKLAFTYPQKIERLIVADIAPRKYSTDFHKNLLMKLVRLQLAGFKTRIVASILFLFVLTVTLIFHTDFSNSMQIISFLKNTAIMGGLLIIISSQPQMCSIDYYLKQKKR